MPEIRPSSPEPGNESSKDPRNETKAEQDDDISSSKLSLLYQRFTYTPKKARYHPDRPVEFTTFLNILFGMPSS